MNGNVDGGGAVVEASEPSGEGAVVIVVIADKDGNSVDGSGGQCVDSLLFCQNPDFDLDAGLQNRILTPSRVEMIAKGSILRLETTTNR